MIVNQPTKSRDEQKKQLKQAHEKAYIKFIEDFFSFSVRGSKNIFMMHSIPTLMSSAFVSLKNQALIKQKISEFVIEMKRNEGLQDNQIQ